MKVNELMIDDWVTCSLNGKYYKVSSLTSDVTLEGDKFIFNCLCDYIEPIPLTAEILKKNGFERKEIIQSHWISEDGRILLRNDESLINSNNKWSVHVDNEDMQTIGYFEITYVHELQHALRLAGIDKKFEL